MTRVVFLHKSSMPDMIKFPCTHNDISFLESLLRVACGGGTLQRIWSEPRFLCYTAADANEQTRNPMAVYFGVTMQFATFPRFVISKENELCLDFSDNAIDSTLFDDFMSKAVGTVVVVLCEAPDDDRRLGFAAHKRAEQWIDSYVFQNSFLQWHRKVELVAPPPAPPATEMAAAAEKMSLLSYAEAAAKADIAIVVPRPTMASPTVTAATVATVASVAAATTVATASTAATVASVATGKRAAAFWTCDHCNEKVNGNMVGNTCLCGMRRPTTSYVARCGDWTCKCGESNLSHRHTCRMCFTPRRGDGDDCYLLKSDEWRCQDCFEVNRDRRDSCFTCGSLKVGGKWCTICGNARANALFGPCIHAVACMDCARPLKHCLKCGSAIFTIREKNIK